MSEHGQASKSWLHVTFSPLSNTVFRNIWLAGTASHLGTIIQATAAAWLMTTMTTSPTTIAAVQSAANAPMVLLALAAGTSADLFNKRLQMLFANILCFIAILLLVTFTATDAMTPGILLALTAMIAIGSTSFIPAWHASVIEIVPRAKLAASVSLNNLAFNVARALTPAIAAEIIAFAGVVAAFAVNGVSYMLMIAAVLAWPYKPKSRTLPREAVGRAMIDGIRFVSLAPGLRLHIIRGFLLTLFASAILSLQPVLAIDLDLGARGFGTLLTSFGIGAILGSLTIAWVRIRMSPQHQWTAAMTLLGVSTASLAFSNSLLPAAFSMVFCGAAWTQSAATLQVTIQTSAPRWVTARIISIFSTVLALGVTIGALLWGSVASISGLSMAFAVSGSCIVVVAAVSAMVSFHDPEEKDLQPDVDAQSANLPELNPRVGPICLTVEYKVPEQNVAQFLPLMREYAQTRRRDGARNYALTQDIDHPEIWVERFHSPTWGDHLHRISRALVADGVIREKIRSLCVEDPKWRQNLLRSGLAQALPHEDSAQDEKNPPTFSIP